MALEIKTIKSIPAVLEFNYDEFFKEVSMYSEKYKDLIVTEENIKDMTKVKAELSKAEKFIEDYRKDIKKEMEKPIKAFETKCKTLLGVIQSVSDPIKLQLNHFEDERKRVKEQAVLQAIKNLVEKIGLKPKYASQLSVIPKYLNKTQSDVDTVKDLESRGQMLLISQQQEEQLEQLKAQKVDLIQVTIEDMNKKYQTELKISEFKFLEDREISEIPKTIEARANYIYQERLAKENATRTIQSSKVYEEQKEKSKPRPQRESTATKTYTFTLELQEINIEQAKELKTFLEANGLNYKLINK